MHRTNGLSNYYLSNALHSSIGQNIKSLGCPMSGVRSPVSGPSVKKIHDHNSETRHPIDFVFGSRFGFFYSKNGL